MKISVLKYKNVSIRISNRALIGFGIVQPYKQLVYKFLQTIIKHRVNTETKLSFAPLAIQQVKESNSLILKNYDSEQ